MGFIPRGLVLPSLIIPLLAAITVSAQPLPQSSSSSGKSSKQRDAFANGTLDSGTVSNGIYRNKTLGLAFKIPDGWVLRTDEMNAPVEGAAPASSEPAASSAGAHVLLAAFSRPPEAKGEEVNGSILIAAESAAAYPGLTDAAQYFGPLTEVAKGQGFETDEDPYEIQIGPKVLVRGDFHRDVGTRVMRQSTLAMLIHGYAVSITLIAGTEDELEDLLDGLQFQSSPTAKKSPK